MRTGQRSNPTNPDAEKKLAARERVRKHRESLRARGLRPIQIWVPDTRRPGFAEEARRQCLAANDPVHDKELFDFMDAVLADTKWD
jgi:hypothetical protein